MARITVEDCMKKVTNRFMLVALVSQLARDIQSGIKITISNYRDDKPTVLGLREVAVGHVTIAALINGLLRRLRAKNKVEPIDDEENITLTEDNSENFDYLPSGSDLYVTEDYSDLEEQGSDGNVSEEEQKL